MDTAKWIHVKFLVLIDRLFLPKKELSQKCDMLPVSLNFVFMEPVFMFHDCVNQHRGSQ